MNRVNKVLRDFNLEKNMPIVDDVPIKKCIEEENGESLDIKRCCKFVTDHIVACNKILARLEEVHFTLSRAKLMFRIKKILIVGHICRPHASKPFIEKIVVI